MIKKIEVSDDEEDAKEEQTAKAPKKNKQKIKQEPEAEGQEEEKKAPANGEEEIELHEEKKVALVLPPELPTLAEALQQLLPDDYCLIGFAPLDKVLEMKALSINCSK